MKSKNKKIKYIEPKMEFNPGTQKYEPILPLKKADKRLNIKVDWKSIIIGIIVLAILIGLLLFVVKKGFV